MKFLLKFNNLYNTMFCFPFVCVIVVANGQLNTKYALIFIVYERQSVGGYGIPAIPTLP